MKLKFIKRYVVLIIGLLILFACVLGENVFASLDNLLSLGGSYTDVRSAVISYLIDHPDDKTRYECHHLISKQALNNWGAYISEECGENIYNEFLTNDECQGWGPSIAMEKADHEKTCSYFDSRRPRKEQMKAINYIEEQTYRIIKRGDIIGVLRDEIDFIRRTFGNKYDRAIREVWEYVNSLNFRHECRRTLFMTHPGNPKWFFKYNFR